MTRKELQDRLLEIFEKNFEIENPGLDDNLREQHEFDSIDAIELLAEIERLLDVTLSQEEKKMAMDVRTLNDICDYVESIIAGRQAS